MALHAAISRRSWNDVERAANHIRDNWPGHDLTRAIAVIADQNGAGRPGVNESAEELAGWAEEFTDMYFDEYTDKLMKKRKIGYD